MLNSSPPVRRSSPQGAGTLFFTRSVVLSLYLIAALAVPLFSIAQLSPVYVTRNDFRNVTLNKLTPAQRVQSADYKTSINSSLSRVQPFYPYVPVNFSSRLLPPPPVRIYLGKGSLTDADDYLLLVVHCNNYDTTINRGETLHYLDDSLVTPAGTPWYSVRVFKTSGKPDRITYTRLTKKRAAGYIRNFVVYMQRKSLAGRYPLCFVVQRKRTNLLKLQPFISRRAPLPRSSKSSLRPFYIFNFDSDQYDFQDADGGTDLCCKAPPETGNSVKQ